MIHTLSELHSALNWVTMVINSLLALFTRMLSYDLSVSTLLHYKACGMSVDGSIIAVVAADSFYSFINQIHLKETTDFVDVYSNAK